ncbi:MAG: Na/Pi cotransporter family protein [Lachnospiraceae bacterium]
MTKYELFVLLGGIGLFLYGMSLMSQGLRNACGENLQKILEGATKSKLRAVLVGVAITILIQSSSATDVMVIGFVNSGLMTLSQAIGVIMGANIGTTITAQVTAFNLSAYAPVILFVGAVIFIFVKKQLVKHIGSIIMGFGMLFEGIALMKSAISPLAETQEFVGFVSSMSNPIVLVIFGVLFTALLQSSSSATVIFQAFAIQGILTYQSSVYLLIGSAIGSVTPNLLASLTTNREGKRTALLNLLFNLFRAAILLCLITIFPVILTWIPMLSPDNIGRQIANTHTIFAIFAVLVMLPFSDKIVKLSQRILKPRPDEICLMEEKKLHYMNNIGQVPPAIILTQARKEITRMGSIASSNLEMAIESFFNQDGRKGDEALQMEEVVDYLNKAIVDKLVELHAVSLSQKDMNTVHNMMLVVSHFERISDYAENVVEYAERMKNANAVLSENGKQDLYDLAMMCQKEVALSVEIFGDAKIELLQQAEELEENVDNKQVEIIDGHVKRLANAGCNPLAGVIFTDMANDLERCSDHAIGVARTVISSVN